MNLSRCLKCGLSLIQEEIAIHECKDAVDYKFEENILWMFDGEFWIPRKLQQPIGNTKKTDEDVTEPQNGCD
jgi:hypothetical protein